MSPFIAEIIGTLILMLLGNGVVANVILKDTKGANSGWLVITTGWGIAVFVAVFIVQDFSGAHINPAVTIGLAVAGKFPWVDVAPYILAQMIGAMIGSAVVWIMYKDHYRITENKSTKLGTFATIPQIPNTISNVFSELLGTFVLVFAVLYIAGPNLAAGDPSQPVGLGSLGALPVGLVVFGIGLSLGGTTGYAINPARDLGPRIMHAILPIENKGPSNWSYAWIPIVGPIVGSTIAAILFLVL